MTSSYGALDVETAGVDVGIEVEHAPARLVDAPVDLAAIRGPPEQIDAADVGVGADSKRGVAGHHQHEPADVDPHAEVGHAHGELDIAQVDTQVSDPELVLGCGDR